MTASMHEWDESTDLFAHAVIGYAIERLKVPKDPQWGAHKATDLAATLDTSITPTGIGGHAALAMTDVRWVMRQTRSTMVAMPMPPPTHSVASP